MLGNDKLSYVSWYLHSLHKRAANGILRLLVQVRFNSENKSSYFRNHKRLFVPTCLSFSSGGQLFSFYPFTVSALKDTTRLLFFLKFSAVKGFFKSIYRSPIFPSSSSLLHLVHLYFRPPPPPPVLLFFFFKHPYFISSGPDAALTASPSKLCARASVCVGASVCVCVCVWACVWALHWCWWEL